MRVYPCRFRLPALLAIVALAGGAALADFKDGLAAYEVGDYPAALAEWQPLAEQGVVEAQYNLGLLYSSGKGIERDLALAHEWFLAAAEQGYDRAQYRVAEMFEKGEGLRADLVQARMWFTLAVEQRYLDAKKRRRKLAKSMSPEQIAHADMLARHRKRDEKAGN